MKSEKLTGAPMQKSLSDFTALPGEELSRLLDKMNGPLLITNDGEPQFIAQSLPAYEAMIRRLRHLETALKNQTPSAKTVPRETRGRVIPIRP